jgi:drug/metabolite transporter (DMT)-like permease
MSELARSAAPVSENAPASLAQAPAPAAWRGWGLALLSTVCFSIAPPIARVMYDLGLNPTTMLFVRFAITLAVIGVTAHRRLRIERGGLLIALGGGLATGVSMLAYFWALTRMAASIASMVFSLYPLAVLAVLALRGEKFTHRHLVRLGLGLTGVYLLIGPGGAVDWVGVLLVLLAICTSSVQSVFIQWYLREYDGFAITFYMVVGIQTVVALRWLMEGASLSVPGWAGWLGIITLAVVSTFLSRLFWFGSVRHLGSGQVAMLVPLETLLTVVWSILFLGETLSPTQALGGALILLSALLASQRLLRVRRPAAPLEGEAA